MLRRLLAVALCVALGSGCSLQMLHAPHGHLTLTATFNDATDLTQGNTVQTSNVTIGSVTHVKLVGYRALVTMSIKDGHRIPVGTVATIRRTSFLGEHFVDLAYPSKISEYLRSGASLPDTTTDPEIDQILGRAGQFLVALDNNDIAAVVQTGAEALQGRGPELHNELAQISQYLGLLDGWSAALASAIDNLGKGAESLVPLSGQLGALLDSSGSILSTVAANRDRLSGAMGAFNQLTVTSAHDILSHADTISQLLGQAMTFLTPLAANPGVFRDLEDNLAAFVPKIPKAVDHGQLLTALWGQFDPQLHNPALAAYLNSLIR